MPARWHGWKSSPRGPHDHAARIMHISGRESISTCILVTWGHGWLRFTSKSTSVDIHAPGRSRSLASMVPRSDLPARATGRESYPLRESRPHRLQVAHRRSIRETERSNVNQKHTGHTLPMVFHQHRLAAATGGPEWLTSGKPRADRFGLPGNSAACARHAAHRERAQPGGGEHSLGCFGRAVVLDAIEDGVGRSQQPH